MQHWFDFVNQTNSIDIEVQTQSRLHEFYLILLSNKTFTWHFHDSIGILSTPAIKQETI